MTSSAVPGDYYKGTAKAMKNYEERRRQEAREALGAGAGFPTSGISTLEALPQPKKEKYVFNNTKQAETIDEDELEFFGNERNWPATTSTTTMAAAVPLALAPAPIVIENDENYEGEGTTNNEISLKYKYDPEFGNQISDRKQMITLLKKALKDLEAEEQKSKEEKQIKYPLPTNLFELLLNYVLNPEMSLENILNIHFQSWNRTRSRTSLFEALWIIVIGLGFLDKFPIENIQLVDWRNVNKEQAPEIFRAAGNSSKVENILNILKNMPFGTRAGGVSDITFFYSDNPESLRESPYKEGCGMETCQERQLVEKVYISSVKFFELDIKKNIDKFDIAPLIAATDILAKENKEYEILLFVKDSRAVSTIVDQARKKYLSNKVAQENIFGEQHLLAALSNLREKILNSEGSTIDERIQAKFGEAIKAKSFLSLRFHQELIVEKVNHYITTTSDTQKTALIGVLPRGGKTYICGGIVTKLKPKNVLVLTHVPKETYKQFINDLFMKFADFSEYEVKYLKDEGESEDYVPTKNYIIFTSYQLLKTAHVQQKEGKNIKRKLLKSLVSKTLIPDVCFLDEAHFGSAGNVAQEIYKTFDVRTIRILMTATYIRPYYQFIPNQPNKLFHWDYEDIQLGKKLINGDVFQKFRERHLLEGEEETSTDTVFDKVLESQRSKGNTIDVISRIYSKFPNIEIINSSFETKAQESFSDQLLEDGSKGFSMESILAVNSKKPIPTSLTNAYSLFQNPGVVGKFLNYIQPREGSYLTSLGGTSVDHIEGDLSYFNIMDRIYFDSSQSEGGNRLTKGIPHTQIWFIPPSNGVQKRIFALASLLLQHPWFSENFCVIGVSGGESDKIQNPNEVTASISINTFLEGKCLNISCANSDDLKACIENQERKNRCAEKPKGTIILTGYMLRMGISLGCADVVMLFDDDENPDSTIQKMFRALTESKGKEKSYVVDLNPRRSIKAICDHVRGVKEKPSEVSSNVYTTVINTFGINSDRFLIPSPGGKVIKYSELLTNVQHESQSIGTSKNIRDLIKDSEDILKSFDDSEIAEELGKYFFSSYSASMDFKEQKERERKERGEGKDNNGLGGSGRTRLQIQAGENDESSTNTNDTNSDDDIAPVKKLSPAQRFENFKKIIDTTLKLVAFSTNATTIQEVYDHLSNEEIKDLLYSTLIQRGLIQDVMIKGHIRSKGVVKPPFTQEETTKYQAYNNEQKEQIVTDIQKSLYMLREKKPNIIYRGMKKKVNDKKVDQQKILEYIDDNLAPTTELKDEYGEVFTPMKLVNEMLDALEKTDTEIFTDKNKKWLDPANGMGNFPVAVFYRLMQKLKGVSTDPETRAEYIVKNMLYMVEIQKENSAKARRIFRKLAPGVEVNILTCNTLTEFIVNKNFTDGTKEFDIIMGNPPFNPPKTETGSSGNSIWQNFVMKSYSLLKENGYLCFVHPPGWKKPTEEEYKADKFKSGDYSGQVRQGQIWQVLKEHGVFTFIYTNDQKSKSVGDEYLHFFPAVDYYVYKKGGSGRRCDTKNIFISNIIESKNIKLNYNLSYLPVLITKETQEILDKVSSKEGNKPSFSADRKLTFGKNLFAESSKGQYKYIYSANKSGPIYAYSATEIPNLKEDKVVMTFSGGIDAYHVNFIEGKDNIGSAHQSMFSKVSSKKEGKNLETFFKSDMVKFIFLITQYASGARTVNEPLVANSITIPPEGTTDYYKFFGIEEHKEYIESILAKYAAFKAPKRVAKTAKAVKTKAGGSQKRFNKTRKAKRT